MTGKQLLEGLIPPLAYPQPPRYLESVTPTWTALLVFLLAFITLKLSTAFTFTEGFTPTLIPPKPS